MAAIYKAAFDSGSGKVVFGDNLDEAAQYVETNYGTQGIRGLVRSIEGVESAAAANTTILSQSFANEADMHAALGNPPAAQYVGKTYAWFDSGINAWHIVEVV